MPVQQLTPILNVSDLAESFEAALRVADGRAIALEMDAGTAAAGAAGDEAKAPAGPAAAAGAREHLFSSKFGCPVCSYSLPELEPRLFSFNSPVGACTACDGLGQVTAFDPERVVAFPSLSLASGAVKGWDRRNAYTFSLLQSVARHYGFDVEQPFESLPDEAKRVLLFGSGGEDIEFVYRAESAGSGRARTVKRRHPFEGIIPNFERRFRETDSVHVREELARYQGARPCPACHGTRLRREARHVFLQGAADDAKAARGRAIYEVEHATLADTLAYFSKRPPQAQREDPVIFTPNVPVYDFVTGQTLDVTRIDGGNPALRASSNRIFSLSGRYKPFDSSSLTVNVSYSHIRTRNQIGALPAVTAAIEAAFPERFTRDAGGQLVSIDARPLNFARAEQRQLSWGLFWSHPLGGSQPGTLGGRRTDLPNPHPPRTGGADEQAVTNAGEPTVPQDEARRSGGSGRGGVGRVPDQGHILLSLNHIWRIQNDLLMHEGLPTLDLLGGDAFGGRGQARHQLDFRANAMSDGLGATVEASWQSGSRLHGSTTDLTFSDLATVNLRLFLNLGQQETLSTKHPIAEGARLSLDVANLFDSRMHVRDQLGNTPLSYSSAYLDPLGRTVKLSLRKLL